MSKPATQNPCSVYDFTMPITEANADHYTVSTFLRKIAKKFTFQHEEGKPDKNGDRYQHYQGRLSLKHQKLRLHQVVQLFADEGLQAHISITHKLSKDNDFYASKPDSRVNGPWTEKEEVFDIPEDYQGEPKWYPWQKEVISWIDIRDKRAIDVIWDRKGNKGKSYLSIWLMVRGQAERIPVQKEARDISRMVMNVPIRKLYFIDLPRADKRPMQHTYAAIEEIKNGIAFDDRYHFERKIFNAPRVVVFCNELPDVNLLSPDRWRFWMIDSSMQLVRINHFGQIVEPSRIVPIPPVIPNVIPSILGAMNAPPDPRPTEDEKEDFYDCKQLPQRQIEVPKIPTPRLRSPINISGITVPTLSPRWLTENPYGLPPPRTPPPPPPPVPPPPVNILTPEEFDFIHHIEEYEYAELEWRQQVALPQIEQLQAGSL